MEIIKKIFKSIFIAIGGAVSIFITGGAIYTLIDALIKVVENFDLYYYFTVAGYVVIYLLVVSIILYSIHLFSNWLINLIEKKRK